MAAARLTPRVVFGLPLYNGEAHLAEALESLLSQDFRDFRIVVADDASDDGGATLAERYADRDERVELVRTRTRTGMVANWRTSFTEARARYPDAEYFAWASDHDVWHPRWLSTLVATLEADPDAVAAYPRTLGISETGQPLLPGARAGFQTVGISSPRKRVVATVDGLAAGNMIYGLFRARALERCGSFPNALLPDRLLLVKLAVLGTFVEVPRMLWFRRYRAGVRASLARQRRSLFATRTPARARLPWWLHHAAAFGWWITVRRDAAGVGRAQGVRIAVAHALWTFSFFIARRARISTRDQRRTIRAWKRRIRRMSRRGYRRVRRFAARGRVVRRSLAAPILGRRT